MSEVALLFAGYVLLLCLNEIYYNRKLAQLYKDALAELREIMVKRNA